MSTATWQSKAAAKKAAQEALIPDSLRLPSPPADTVLDVTTFALDSVLSARDLEITNVPDLTTLTSKLQSGAWSAVEVTQAFCNRALVAHQLTNCLTEIFVDQALERAKELDAIFAKTGPVGPLHGLPISLKDQIDVKGIEMTMGYVGWIGNVSKENAVLVDLLLAQGAVIYVRTNVPTALMFGEAVNNVWGTTSNPFNRALTCGGSSGGEGALIGLRGSLLGVGSDVGGSIRIPSAFQGLYGLRPSYSRIPYQGTTNSMEGQEAIKSVLGPMTISIDGLKLFTKAVIDAKPWLADPIALRMPWSEDEYNLASHGGPNGKLCFAILWDDLNCMPQPPYKRALETTKKALEAAGHAVVDWVPYGAVEGCQLMNDIFNADGGEDIQGVCDLSGEPRLGWVLDHNAKPLSTYEYWQLCFKRTSFIKRHLDHWQATASQTGTGRPVDAILMPANAGAPQPHGQLQYIFYTGLSNLTDCTAAVVPVTRVDPALDPVVERSEFYSDIDQTIHELYDPSLMANAPIGIQVVGMKSEEEAVIRMAEIVDAALKDSA